MRTAVVNSFQPRASSTDSKRPAIDEYSVSSYTEEERTTTARAEPCAPASACQARRIAFCPAGALGARCAGTSTKPGSTGSPATAARARCAALAPVRFGSWASGASSGMTASSRPSIDMAHYSCECVKVCTGSWPDYLFRQAVADWAKQYSKATGIDLSDLAELKRKRPRYPEAPEPQGP
ncbi:hypothetical protein GCM10022206_28690 [Streptomyces chiangmaiensis]